MALGVVVNSDRVVGDRRALDVTITFDNSYPTGGETLALSDLGGRLRAKIDNVEVEAFNTAASRIIVWDAANSKLKVFTALSTEAANASDQSTISVRALITGY